MPEGPEVRVMADHLNEILSNGIITRIDIIGGRYEKKPPDYWKELGQSLPLAFDQIQTKGK